MPARKTNEIQSLEDLRASWTPAKGCLFVEAQMQDGVLGQKSDYSEVECPCPDCDDTKDTHVVGMPD